MSLRSFGRAFFAGDPAVDRFLPRARTLDALLETMGPPTRGPDVLYEELKRQNPGGPVERLREGSAVITGQQVGLFLGPLYTLHKALSAVLLAEALRAKGRNAVAVFWLQTEDHDLPEVDQAAVRDAGGHRHLLTTTRSPSRVSLAHHRSDAQTQGVLSRLRERLATLPRGPSVLEKLEAAYAEGTPYAEAFARCLRMVFSEDELLIFDPRSAAIGRCVLPLHRAACAQSRALGEALQARAKELAQAGFGTQVPVREDCSLSFFHPEGPSGPRYRLRTEGAHFSLAGGDVSYGAQELEALSEDEPLRFSSSALLRPVIQDFLFPSCAYVGGPGELSYYAQLAPIYAALGVRPGAAVPRLRARYLSSTSAERIARWQAQEPLDAPASWTTAISDVVQAKDEVDAMLDDVRTRLGTLANWPKAVAKAQRSIEGAVSRLKDTFDREALLRSDVQRDYQAVLAELAPGGAAQERSLSAIDLLARYAPSSIRAALKPMYAPLEDRVLTVSESLLGDANAERSPHGNPA